MDGASLENALQRMETALARIERAAARAPSNPYDAELATRHEQLRGAVAQSIRQIDELLANRQP